LGIFTNIWTRAKGLGPYTGGQLPGQRGSLELGRRGSKRVTESTRGLEKIHKILDLGNPFLDWGKHGFKRVREVPGKGKETGVKG